MKNALFMLNLSIETSFTEKKNANGIEREIRGREKDKRVFPGVTISLGPITFRFKGARSKQKGNECE